eukprot:TRINITY_DN50866_c0_g1_i1.p1 TRINITY_DN50866_c0_g1~~TRINITY_DN50866_c0_g1_i1.p1  ORF type:complete len:194 (-),score=23.19 TRINITY_DN50866_c0_g1_i1:154-684(-)
MDEESYDEEIIDACRRAAARQVDGRLSETDVIQIFSDIFDWGNNTQRKRWTLRHCLHRFTWTDAARTFVVDALQKMQPARKRQRLSAGELTQIPSDSIDVVRCDRDMIGACQRAVECSGDGRIPLEGVSNILTEASDGASVVDAKRLTLAYCLTEFLWTDNAYQEALRLTQGGSDR